MNVTNHLARIHYEGLKQAYASSICDFVAPKLAGLLTVDLGEQEEAILMIGGQIADAISRDPSSCLAITEQGINGRTVLKIRYRLSQPLMPGDLHSPPLLELTGELMIDLDDVLGETEDEDEE